jgi:NAD(P)-dependent dehydrogenase (short-subunit alcohol dehydrogenase family)
MTTSDRSHGGRVAGKVALITGGARGMGTSHGRALAQHGARVVLAGRNDDRGEKTAAALRAEGLGVEFIHLDVTLAADWDLAVKRIEKTHGKLDVLVNNAGIYGPSNILDCSLAEWNDVIAVNQTGVFLGIKHCALAMRRAGGGSIVNISSVLGTMGTAFAIAYHASKGAVHLLTRAAAVTLAPGVRVNTITPAITETDMASEMGSEQLKARVARYPMGRAAQPEEISQGVLFLASDESAFVTGADFRIDGGALAGVKDTAHSFEQN